MHIAIGCDHAGFDFKQSIVKYLETHAYSVIDHGTDSTVSVDYPDFVHPTARSVQEGKAIYGILICGSANGVAMTANKYPEIRAAIAWQKDVAALARQHNNANIICIPARFIDIDMAEQIIDIFLNTDFQSGRHQRRINKMLPNEEVL